MAEHPVRRMLKRDVLPYFFSARRLRQQWFYRLHVMFGYTTDLVVALAAIGVSSPLMSLVGSSTGSHKDAASPASLGTALKSVPDWLLLPTVVSVVLWIALRVAFNREDGQKRAVLAKNCFQLLKQAEARLPALLAQADPRADITTLLEKAIRVPVDRNIQEEAWPWTPFAPDIDGEVDKEVESLCSRYEADWANIDVAVQQRPQ
jgi:hypothetical protein